MKIFKHQNWKTLSQQKLVAVLTLILFAGFSAGHKAFISWNSIDNILRIICLYGFASLGMTPVILLGGTDLSAGSVMALAGTVGAGLLGNAFGAVNPIKLPFLMTIISALTVSTLIGAFNGILVSKMKIAPFVATLSTMSITRGIVYIFTDVIIQGVPGSPITFMNDGYDYLGNGRIGPIPFQLFLFVSIVVIMYFLLNHTRSGREIYAVGGNVEMARLAGIKTDMTIIMGYAICGLLVGISGLLLIGKLSSASTVAAEGYELDFITAVALGGISMSGGRGSITGTVIGVAFLAVLNNGLNMINVPSFYQYLIKGAILIIAVYSERLLRGLNSEGGAV